MGIWERRFGVQHYGQTTAAALGVARQEVLFEAISMEQRARGGLGEHQGRGRMEAWGGVALRRQGEGAVVRGRKASAPLRGRG